MSLLLEALKKAEKAKEEAQRQARAPQTGAEARLEPTLAPAPEPAEAKPLVTRAELPDIKQPLEILSDDITPNQEPAGAPAAPPPPAEEPPPRPAAPRAEPQAAERATAKKVFEAKFKEPNPKLPFYITLAALGVFALGTVGYFWYQLRPPPALVNANPPRTAAEAPPEVAPARPIAASAASSDPVIPGLPRASAAAPAPAPSAAAPGSPPAVKAAEPEPMAETQTPQRAAPPPERTAPPARRAVAAPRRSARTAALAPAAAAQAASPAVSHSRPVAQVDPRVESAYNAYQSGDLVAARSDYQEALKADAGNRDALLGLAAVDVRTGRFESAEAAYLRLLQMDPNDPHAQAGLIALRTGRLDPLATESRVKTMLAAQPGANVLHFTLGNQLARQGRWAEAQQEYFKAFAAAPGNADFAYNLAVSLDHLRQGRLALEYYQRAIALAQSGGAAFDVAAARTRAAQLAAD